MAETTQSERLNSLQVLRGIAASWVMAFHITALVPDVSEAFRASFFGTVMRLGFAGVDIFFVLSGFVIWRTSGRAEGSGSAIRFLMKRFSRIYLGYWPCLLISALVALLWWPGSLDGKDPIGNVFLMDKDIGGLVIGQAWSLVYELYFYVIFFLFLLITPPTRLRAVLAMSAVNVLWNIMKWQEGSAIISGGNSVVGFVASPFVCEFFAGVMLAAGFTRWRGRQAAVVALIVGTAVAGAALWIGMSAVRERGLEFVEVEILRVFCFGFAAVGAVAALVAAGRLGLRWPRLLVTLGDQSFSLYLLHVLILQIALYIGFAPSSIDERPSNMLWWMGVAGGTLVVTAAFYWWIEYPIYVAACRKIDRWTKSSSA